MLLPYNATSIEYSAIVYVPLVAPLQETLNCGLSLFTQEPPAPPVTLIDVGNVGLIASVGKVQLPLPLALFVPYV